jgi:hypothetical protein
LVFGSTAIPITGSGNIILSRTIGCFSELKVSPVLTCYYRYLIETCG